MLETVYVFLMRSRSWSRRALHFITELIEWGTAFDREGTHLSFSKEAAHSRSRVLHAQGDSTGHEIIRVLLKRAASIPNISLKSHCFTLDLLVQ